MVLNCLSINVHTCILISFIYSVTIIVAVASQIAITNDDTSTEMDGGPITTAKIVDNIRKTMKDIAIVNVPIQAYIIPSVDAHQNEYPTIRDNRVRYVSGFTGSSATIVIAESAAAIWIPSPYYAQAVREVDNSTLNIKKMGMDGVPTFRHWLLDTLPKISSVGIDQSLITSREFHDLNEFLDASGHKLVALPNLVDVVWKDRPAPILNELEPIEQTLSGKKILEKFADVRKALKNVNADSLMITSLEDVAWLLNLRGSDFAYLPVFFANAIITDKDCYLYLMNHERATKNNKIVNHFQTELIDIDIKEYNETNTGINLVIRTTKGKMLLSQASEAISNVVPVERRLEAVSPILGMRILKNDVEANGIREAHRRDGAAVIQYLYWLQTEINDQNITEMKGADKLKEFKKIQDLYRRLGSPTQSAVGAHAAMARYIPTPKTNKRITNKEIYLLNAATQYQDGSTTMTRTIHIGTPSDKEKDSFTRVLKGFISVATAIFPPNAPFSFFDAMARRALWDVGLDYNHETGHGIGAYLNVREIPPLLSSQSSPPGMCRNMFTTNEPGVYEDGAFGIRIQNVLQVVHKSDSSKYFDGKGAYQFDDVTMVPIQTKLINVDLLTQSEVDWINAYHVRVRDNISPLLSNNSNIIEWLQKETQPISKRKEDCKEVQSSG